MKNYLASHPYAKIGVFALLLLPFVLLINSYSPPVEKIPTGFSSTILAFEFIQDKDDLKEVLGVLTSREMDDLDTINYIDFVFMIFYSSLLFLFLKKSLLVQPGRFNQSLLIIPLFILLADFGENIQLLRLTEAFSSPGQDSVAKVISWLKVFTWLKWGGLGLCFLIFARGLFHSNKLSKSVSIIFCLPTILLAVVILTGSRKSIDLFATSVFVMFFVLTIYCLLYKNDKGATIPGSVTNLN